MENQPSSSSKCDQPHTLKEDNQVSLFRIRHIVKEPLTLSVTMTFGLATFLIYYIVNKKGHTSRNFQLLSSLFFVLLPLLRNFYINVDKYPLKRKGDLKPYSGRTVIITGGTSGIGKAAAYKLFMWGAKVIIGTRNINNNEILKAEFLKEFSTQDAPENDDRIQFFPITLDDLESVKKFAQTILKTNEKIDYLINNAGIMAPVSCKLSHLGLDSQFITNHLGHFLLTYLLLDTIKKSHGRIINVSSMAHIGVPLKNIDIRELSKSNPDNYDPYLQYSFSKMCNIWFTRELQLRLDQDPENKCTTYSCHPGVVISQLARDSPIMVKLLYFVLKPIMRTSTSASDIIIHLCEKSKEELAAGCYYQNCKLGLVFTPALDNNYSEELWDYSVELITPYLF